MPSIEVKNNKGVVMELVINPELQQNVILDKVLDAYDIEVPQELVDEEFKMIVLEFNHRAKYESMATGRLLEFTPDETEDRIKQFKEEAFKLVKTRLVLKRIIEEGNLEVTKEELEEEAKALSVRQQIPIEMVKDFLGENLELLKDDLLVRKAIVLANSNAVIK